MKDDLIFGNCEGLLKEMNTEYGTKDSVVIKKIYVLDEETKEYKQKYIIKEVTVRGSKHVKGHDNIEFDSQFNEYDFKYDEVNDYSQMNWNKDNDDYYNGGYYNYGQLTNCHQKEPRRLWDWNFGNSRAVERYQMKDANQEDFYWEDN